MESPPPPDIGTIDAPDIPGLGEIVATIANLAFFAAAVFFLIQILIGGISWINSGGDPKALDNARKRMQNAIIGLVLVVASFAITLVITSALGVNIFDGGTIKLGDF